MSRPWQVWLLYLLCLSIVVAAMGWLTHKALELDEQVTLSARQADLEEDISLALWRMDVALAPLVAQEAARPYLVYRPFLGDPLAAGGKGSLPVQVSPILVQPSEFVRLHFEIDADGNLSSPQCPVGPYQELAVDNNAPRTNIAMSCDQLAVLSETVNFPELVQRLPSETLPPLDVTELAWNNRQNLWNFNPSTDANDPGQNILVQSDQQAQQLYDALPNQPAQNEDDVPQQASRGVPNRNDLANNSRTPNAQPNPQMAGPPTQQQAEAWNDQYTGNYYGYGRAPRVQTEKGQLEFQRRNKALQTYANSEMVKQRQQLPIAPPTQAIREGVSAPLWQGDELLLARRVQVDDGQVVQGCWFDWPKLKQFLITEGTGGDGLAVAALPAFDLRPIATERDVSPARRLATLPVEIVVPTPPLEGSWLTPIRLSLGVAWICMVLATGAVAILLQGVVTLSERRGAFVSAVTHELRTPLTTFRMYAEMLSEGMVRDSKQQQQYTDTLRVEADRLSHLVENVLAYARLERGRKGGRREEISLDAILKRVESRLIDRAGQAGMQLKVDVDDQARRTIVHTDPQAVEQILFNLVDNACKYAQTAADRTIHIEASLAERMVTLVVRDHGPGISKAFAKRLFQPFSKSAEDAAVSAPGVGLGLALCRRLAREIGGGLELDDGSPCGAAFRLSLPR